MPADEKTNAEAYDITADQKCIGGEAREWLRRAILYTGNRVINVFRLVGIVPEVLAQPPRQVPDASHKKRYQHCASSYTERLPEWRFNHRHKKCGEKKRDGGENRALPLLVLSAIVFQNLVDYPIPARLGGDVAGALGVRIIRVKN